MDLSNDLISKFVKITNDADKPKSKEGTVYGTAVEYEGEMYVKIDGSDLLTPTLTTSDIKDGERVNVMIKNHSATVTGNVTSPSASSTDVKQVEDDVKKVEEDLVVTNEKIDNLDVGDLSAVNAEIENLKVGKADIEYLEADYAKIEYLEAEYAKIERLEADYAEINTLIADKATIKDLNAVHANIEILDAEVADINTLINGNLTSDNILSLHLTAQNTTVDNAFIKDAMIDTVTANKIMSGTIDTNNVTIQSTDGSMLLQGTLIQMKDDNGTVRIQIGKDNGGNFTFILYDENGTGVLIDEEGIKSSDAIADGLIVDAKVSENANISGGKLDIASVISSINEDGSTTIKSNKIYLDDAGQTLEVAFNTLNTKVEEIEVNSGGSEDLTSLKEQVQSNTTQINVNSGRIDTLVAENAVITEQITNLDGEITEVDITLSSKYSSLEQELDGFRTSVADTYATKTSVTDLSDNLTANYSTTSVMNSTIDQRVDEISSSVSSTYATKSSVTDLNNTLLSNYSTTTQMNSAINQKANQITSSVSTTYATKAEVSELAVIGTNLWVTGDLTCGYVGGDSNNLGKTVAHTNTSQQVRKTLVSVSDCSYITYQCWNPNKVDSSYNGLYLTARVAFFNSNGTCISVTALPVLNGTTYQSLTISVPSNAALVKLAAICGIRNASNSGDNYDDSILIKFEKGSTGTDWSPAPQDTVTMASLESAIKQTSTEVVTSFLEDGFETGIITLDANGIKVEHTATKGWTHMSATGFYVSDGTNDIISATNGNVTITGTIYATAGEIGGYTISGNQLIGTNVGMSGLSGEGHAFWAGNAVSGNAPFRVGHNGFLRATNAEITGTINATAGTFSGNVETTNIMKAYGAVYAGTELWGGFTKNSSGVFESRSTFTVSATNNMIVKGSKVYLYPTSGEVVIGDTSSYDNLRARELYAQEIVYTDALRSRTSSVTGTQNLLVESGNGYVEFGSGYGVVRVAENNHLYLQCGSTSGSTSSEVRCTLYKSSSSYANLRAHNVCAQNAVYAAGVNVSSDRNRKRDIEKYEVDALQEVCSTPVYAYHLDVDKDEEMKRIGIIMQEAPVDAIDLTGKGIDLYQMVSMLWKAVQQLNDKLEG